MDSPEFPSGKSPRRELQLQGPRPAPLKVRKDSHKIKKPPIAPPHHHHQQQQPSQQHHHRPPVIIYTVSPKVIHTNPSDFMTLVQRLTGSSSSTYQENSGAISPAARFASLEKTKTPSSGCGGGSTSGGDEIDMVGGIDISTTIGSFPGILSPGPGSLPPIPPNFFSPPSDPNIPLGFFHDLSPVLHSNRNYMEGIFTPSPSNFLSSYTNSPTPSLDLFNNFFDL